MHVDDIADRIAIARPDELDWIIRDMWVDHTNGLLDEAAMEVLDEAARARREAFQARQTETRSLRSTPHRHVHCIEERRARGGAGAFTPKGQS